MDLPLVLLLPAAGCCWWCSSCWWCGCGHRPRTGSGGPRHLKCTRTPVAAGIDLPVVLCYLTAILETASVASLLSELDSGEEPAVLPAAA